MGSPGRCLRVPSTRSLLSAFMTQGDVAGCVPLSLPEPSLGAGPCQSGSHLLAGGACGGDGHGYMKGSAPVPVPRWAEIGSSLFHPAPSCIQAKLWPSEPSLTYGLQRSLRHCHLMFPWAGGRALHQTGDAAVSGLHTTATTTLVDPLRRLAAARAPRASPARACGPWG